MDNKEQLLDYGYGKMLELLKDNGEQLLKEGYSKKRIAGFLNTYIDFEYHKNMVAPKLREIKNHNIDDAKADDIFLTFNALSLLESRFMRNFPQFEKYMKDIGLKEEEKAYLYEIRRYDRDDIVLPMENYGIYFDDVIYEDICTIYEEGTEKMVYSGTRDDTARYLNYYTRKKDEEPRIEISLDKRHVEITEYKYEGFMDTIYTKQYVKIVFPKEINKNEYKPISAKENDKDPDLVTVEFLKDIKIFDGFLERKYITPEELKTKIEELNEKLKDVEIEDNKFRPAEADLPFKTSKEARINIPFYNEIDLTKENIKREIQERKKNSRRRNNR